MRSQQIFASLLTCAVLAGCSNSEESAKTDESEANALERAHLRGLENNQAMVKNAKLCEPKSGPGDVVACERACDLNHSNSCANWGRFLAPRNPEQALDLYRRACRGGSGIGCESVALLAAKAGNIDSAALYLNARRYHQVHCSQGYARSCSQLAKLYQAGLGGRVDESTGQSYREHACRLGVLCDCSIH